MHTKCTRCTHAQQAHVSPVFPSSTRNVHVNNIRTWGSIPTAAPAIYEHYECAQRNKCAVCECAGCAPVRQEQWACAHIMNQRYLTLFTKHNGCMDAHQAYVTCVRSSSARSVRMYIKRTECTHAFVFWRLGAVVAAPRRRKHGEVCDVSRRHCFVVHLVHD